MPTKLIKINNVAIGGDGPLAVIAGPCVIESKESALRHAAALKERADRVGVPYIFKSSYDKANRSSVNSFRGLGLDKGLAILAEVKQKIGVPVLTDVHETDQVAAVERGCRHSANPGVSLPPDGFRRRGRPIRQGR